MISEDHEQGKSEAGRAEDLSLPKGFLKARGRRLSLADEKALLQTRGFTRETLQRLGLFSVEEADLGLLGVSLPYSELPSTIAIPYHDTAQGDYVLARLHKVSGEGLRYPPYTTPMPSPALCDIVIAESELKAAMAFQLGDQGVGLQGAQSFVNRVPELANTIRGMGLDGRRVFMVPDHEYLIQDGQREVAEALIAMVRVAHALKMDLGVDVRVILLPERFLVDGHTSGGHPKVKADLDAAVAAGLTEAEWRDIKDRAFAVPDLPFPTWAIAKAMVLAAPDDFLAGEHLKARLQGMVIDDAMEVLKAVVSALRSRCFDAASERTDEILLGVYLHTTVEWANRNELKHVTIKGLRDLLKRLGEALPPEAAGGLLAHCMVEKEHGVVLVKSSGPAEVVAPFLLRSCRYGHVQYVSGPRVRSYRVNLELRHNGKCQKREVDITGNLFEAERYTAADPDLTIADTRRFRMYAGAKLQQAGFQTADPTLDRPLFVGLLRYEDRLLALTDTSFPRRDQDCWYDSPAFPKDGDAARAFAEIAGITRDADIAFVHALGAPLKAVLGFYPLASWIGHRYSGKTTVAEATEARTCLARFSANDQFSSRYRILRAVGNHNLAVMADEMHRLDERWKGAALAAFNTCYNGAICTHGVEGHYYTAGCVIMLGQDRAFSDEALLAKQIVIHFDQQNISEAGVHVAKQNRTAFPLVAWVEFLAKEAAGAQELLAEQKSVLEGKLQERGVRFVSTDRTLVNYAAVLVAAQYLNKFGVQLEITDRVADLCALHLAGKLHKQDEHATARSAAQQFLVDLLEALGNTRDRQAMEGDFDIVAGEGVWIRLAATLRVLRRGRPQSYDGMQEARMGEALAKEFRPKGLTKAKHQFAAGRFDGLLIPESLCVELGVEFNAGSAPQREDGLV
ncbi:MAG: hypothetical protein AMXMBFR7_48870 [Planctomycetota bacterium]